MLDRLDAGLDRAQDRGGVLGVRAHARAHLGGLLDRGADLLEREQGRVLALVARVVAVELEPVGAAVVELAPRHLAHLLHAVRRLGADVDVVVVAWVRGDSSKGRG